MKTTFGRQFITTAGILLLAVLLVAAAAITACSGDDVMTQQPVEPLVTEQADQPIYTLTIDATKDELGGALGRTSCAMAAVTDIGFAANIVGKLADDVVVGVKGDRIEMVIIKDFGRR